MDALNPARQMALIGKARFGRDLGKTEFSFAYHFDCALQSQMNDVTMRAHADGAGEGAGKMELAAVRHFRKRRDIERFVQMLEDELFQPLEDVRGQQAVWLRPGPRRVPCGKDVDELARGLVPEHRP